MAFQTGDFTNSHQLVDIIFGFLLGQGWRHVATLQSDDTEPDGYDHVFHSTGEDGTTDIYIRIAAGLGDRVPAGLIQQPMDDGYTEYINAFAYQYFPDGGTEASDGYNELGRYGPVLYNFHDDDGTWFEHNLFTSGLGPKIVKVLKSRDTGFDDTTSTGGVANFDGKGRLYQSENTVDFRSLRLFDDQFSFHTAAGFSTAYSQGVMGRKRDQTPYIMHLTNDGDLHERTSIYTVPNNTWHRTTGPVTFTDTTPRGFAVKGP
jgi:hypothetical protein